MVIGKSKFWILAVLMITTFMVFLDMSILPVALPKIQSIFNSSEEQLKWIINGYFFSLCVFVVMGGKFSDIFGHRRIFMIGLILFGVFSFFCGLSKTGIQLIVFRVFQGMGSAMMSPSASGLLCEVFSEKERGKAMGLIYASNSVGFVLGPLLGGFFVQYFSWNYIFFINIPIVLMSLIIILKFISKSPKVNKIKKKIDFLSFFYFSFGIFCLTLAFMQGKKWGWEGVYILSLFAISFAFLAFFYFSCKKSKNSFIDFSIFKINAFFCSAIAIFIISLARGISVYWTIFFQNALEFSPIYSGILLTISSLPMIFFSPYAGKLIDKYGPMLPILGGKVIAALSFILFMFFILNGSFVLLSISLIFFGMGVILIILASYTSGLNSVPQEKRGIASGILSTFRNVGSNFGIAIIGIIFFQTQVRSFSSILEKKKETFNINPESFEGIFLKTEKAINFLKSFPAFVQLEVKEAVKKSYDYGIIFSTLFSAFVIFLGFFIIYYYFYQNNDMKASKFVFEDEISTKL